MRQVKQKNLQASLPISARRAVFVALCTLCIAADAALVMAQGAGVSRLGEMASLRIVAVPGLHDGAYRAGVEIRMFPGSHTYWKVPGEAGVPPVFAFNGSENIAAADVQYPVPSRISEEGLEAFGYTGTIVFPVRVIPKDASKPSVLHADVTYAVCNKICLPAHSEGTVILGGSEAAPNAELAAALARVPKPLGAAERNDLTVKREPDTSKPSWTVVWKGDRPIQDLFAVAPDGYYFSTKTLGRNNWTLTLLQAVNAPKSNEVPVSLVLAAGDHSLEAEEKLDLRPPSK